MRQITIYKYEELSSEAKEKAREWWIQLELEDPGWRREHFESLEECEHLLERSTTIQDLQESKSLGLTGYYSDYLLYELALEKGRLPTQEELTEYFERKWEQEINTRIEDIDYIEDAITANEYEFYKNGEKAPTKLEDNNEHKNTD